MGNRSRVPGPVSEEVKCKYRFKCAEYVQYRNQKVNWHCSADFTVTFKYAKHSKLLFYCWLGLCLLMGDLTRSNLYLFHACIYGIPSMELQYSMYGILLSRPGSCPQLLLGIVRQTTKTDMQDCWSFTCCFSWTLGSSSKCGQLKSFLCVLLWLMFFRTGSTGFTSFFLRQVYSLFW